MNDPKRLLDTDERGEVASYERELLHSLQPSAQARAATWRGVVGRGALAAGVAAAVTTSATNLSAASGAGQAAAGALVGKTAGVATGASLSAVAKLGLALAVAAPVLGGAVYFSQTSSTPEPAAASVTTPIVAPRVQARQQSEAQAAAEDVDEPAQPVQEEPAAAKEPVVAASGATRADALREENELLRTARSQARAGNNAAALHTLGELDRRHPSGGLLQERELLRIEALSASGARGAARTRGERFLARYPQSPYAAHVLAILGDAPAKKP